MTQYVRRVYTYKEIQLYQSQIVLGRSELRSISFFSFDVNWSCEPRVDHLYDSKYE